MSEGELRRVGVEVWAWSQAEPTHLMTGTTVKLGTEEAVLRLPRLTEAATRLTLRIALPERGLLAEARVLRRGRDVVEVLFDPICDADHARLLAFLAAR